MPSPLISVIIPVYNGAETLRECLDSVLKQTYPHFEIIVVNNASTDHTAALLESYGSRIRTVYEPYRSRGAARNAGIDAARGSIIAMTDIDCVVPSDWLSQITRPIRQGRERAVMGGEESRDDGYWSRNIQEENERVLQWYQKGHYIRHLDTKNCCFDALLISSLRFNPSIHNLDDLELSIRLREKITIYYVPNIKVAHAHKTNLLSFMKVTINRGYWASVIFSLHRSNELTQEPLFTSFSIKNYFTYFKNLIHRSRTSLSKLFFLLTLGVSWTIGMLYEKLCRLYARPT